MIPFIKITPESARRMWEITRLNLKPHCECYPSYQKPYEKRKINEIAYDNYQADKEFKKNFGEYLDK